tara:strand:- start:194 stop:934 length:741 start_codon:yes stop_codon:yes gene_type:complete
MKVLLLGDSCEDEYIYGNCNRLSPEAPVPVMKLGRVETKSGMAGNVCLNLQAFNLNITFLTNTEKITKTRFIDEASNYQMLRVDSEQRTKPILVPVSTGNFDAVVISDYDKGYLTSEKIFDIVESSSCPVFIDSKKSILPNRSNCFVKINDKEFGNLDQRYPIDNLIVTKGSQGCIYNNTLYPAEKVKVFDVVGAGDTFLAALVFGYLKHKDINKAIMLGNRAAAIAVQHTGTYVLSQTDINELLS